MVFPLGHTKGPSPLIRKLRTLALLQDEHVHVLEEMQAARDEYARYTDLIRTGDDYSRIYVLQSGWAMRSKLLKDGRRQVINFDLPGDFVCLDACLMRRSTYTITLLGDATVSVMEVRDFLRWTEAYPSLGVLIQWMSEQQKSFLVEHLVSLGRRTAYERMAHVLLDLFRRVKLLGLVEAGRFHLPVTQALFADLLGLSTVHVCRTLNRLQADGMLRIRTMRRGMEVELLDYDGLCEAAGIDEDCTYAAEISPGARRRIEIAGGTRALSSV